MVVTVLVEAGEELRAVDPGDPGDPGEPGCETGEEEGEVEGEEEDEERLEALGELEKESLKLGLCLPERLDLGNTSFSSGSFTTGRESRSRSGGRERGRRKSRSGGREREKGGGGRNLQPHLDERVVSREWAAQSFRSTLRLCACN